MNAEGRPDPGDVADRAPLSRLDRQLRREAVRAHRRREQVFGPGADRHDEGPHTGTAVRPANWALALSGGGIRSATFCLGVLQELAQPSAKAVAGLPPRAQAAYAKVGGLLPQFDYVSSVSGGGFIAGFMQALYVQQPGSPQLAAAAVNRHIAEEPPPGVCSGVTPSPLAWLRENGRYLAPSGAGDMAYAFGFAVRNWFGIQCVIGAPIVLAVALLALAARFLATHWAWLSPEWWWAPLAVLVLWILPTAGAYWMTRSVPDGSAVAQMPWLRIIIVTLAGIVALVAGLPLWLNQMQHLPWQFTAIPNLFDNASQWPMYLTVCGSVLLNTAVWALAMRSDGAQSPTPIHWKPFLKFGAVGLVAIAIGLLLMLSEVQERLMSRFPILREALDDTRPIAAYLALGGALVLVSAFLLWLVGYKRHAPQRSKGELAVSLTHACTMGIQVAIVLLILSLILEVAHELLVTHHPHPILVSGGGAGILALAYRALMTVTPLLRGAGSSLGKNRGIPRRALGVALSALGMVLLLGVAVFWTAAAQWLMASRGSEPWASFTARQQTSFEALAQMTLPSAATLALLALAFVVVAGCWRSILNMSSYCHFYSSRLTRAYLGAANPARTTACGTPAAPQPPTMFAPAPHGVARFVSGDSIAYARYYASEAAPLHLINATLNQTVDPAEQLVQRDRKGKPLVVLPPLSKSGRQPFVDVAIGGIFTRVTGEGADLSIGDWLAVSGAAVSTGMGRQTSAGAAICVTLANARIGRWWAGLTGQDGF